jgi:peptidoglycan/xylan/chitin deacetylase (PgdA/CDA1 family)
MISQSLTRSVKERLHGARWYARRLRHDAFPGVLVLCYHGLRVPASSGSAFPFPDLHIATDTFESHCELLAGSCNPIDLPTFQAAQRAGRALPPRPVLVTFDDGYRSVFDLAQPILRQYGIRPAVFVCSQPVQGQRLFWFDAVARARGEAAVDALRALPDRERRQAIAGYDEPAAAADPLAPMTPDQVRQLADENAAVGAHTASHAPLAGAPAAVQRHELDSCRKTLESWTGRSVDTLAYPFGAPGSDYTAETVAIAASAGFSDAFTTRGAFARAEEPPLERSRFIVLASVSAAELAHRIVYSWPRTRTRA